METVLNHKPVPRFQAEHLWNGVIPGTYSMVSATSSLKAQQGLNLLCGTQIVELMHYPIHNTTNICSEIIVWENNLF